MIARSLWKISLNWKEYRRIVSFLPHNFKKTWLICLPSDVTFKISAICPDIAFIFLVIPWSVFPKKKKKGELQKSFLKRDKSACRNMRVLKRSTIL
jgi:hypothetical protein